MCGVAATVGGVPEIVAPDGVVAAGVVVHHDIVFAVEDDVIAHFIRVAVDEGGAFFSAAGLALAAVATGVMWTPTLRTRL